MSSEPALASAPAADTTVQVATNGYNPDTPVASNLDQLIETAEQFLQRAAAPRVSNIQFLIDDIPFFARHDSNKQSQQLQVWTVLGYLPFTAESPLRRQLLVQILRATQNLQHAKFGVTDKKQIIVTTTTSVNDIRPPAFIFPTLIPFYEEAKPYIHLIGECL